MSWRESHLQRNSLDKIESYRGGGFGRAGPQGRVCRKSGNTLCWTSPYRALGQSDSGSDGGTSEVCAGNAGLAVRQQVHEWFAVSLDRAGKLNGSGEGLAIWVLPARDSAFDMHQDETEKSDVIIIWVHHHCCAASVQSTSLQSTLRRGSHQ